MAAKDVQTKLQNGSTAVIVKSDRAKKSELLREIHKLEVQIQAMEREKMTHIYSKRSDFRSDFSQLEEQDNNSTLERKTEKVKVQQQLEKINHMVKRFQRELKDIKPTPEFVERLKVIMEDIESTIKSFKEQQRTKYEELLKDERRTYLDIQNLEKRFESLSQSTSGNNSSRTISHTTSTTTKDITKDLPPEVAAFERFLQQTGGPRGGWDEYDHQTFLKFRQKYKGRIVFLDHLPSAIPTHTETEIREHETWYQEYLFLLDNKKYAIKKWREKKEDDKEDILSKAGQHVELKVESEKEKQQKYLEKLEQEKSERYAMVNAWKVQKELEKAQEQERKLREEFNQKKKKEEERIRQEEMRSKVMNYKQQKEEEDINKEEEERILKEHEILHEQEEKEERSRMAIKEIAKFRHRDQQKLQDKIIKDRIKEEEKIQKEIQKERIKLNVENHVRRDPGRLFQPTAGWKERLKDNKSNGGGQILHMPHRAIPAWRKGP
ncbi:hypothetical protein LOTGIDRAFT_237617 [Lottia gigantea]|uniref:Coiled-coil domain-containing protein 112 n=1 Tax=Lottia gigantea TaxID=225164 RepID=V4CMN4_LOTGI|nr:hypothetical protein LOTGIDRAFT_237617 [Lottia gigantea]ESP03620.1 hypothetical protein LOTGIDRAFT_237617 [Lottia gigantea]